MFFHLSKWYKKNEGVSPVITRFSQATMGAVRSFWGTYSGISSLASFSPPLKKRGIHQWTQHFFEEIMMMLWGWFLEWGCQVESFGIPSGNSTVCYGIDGL